MKLKKTIYGIIAASMIAPVASTVFNPYTAQASTKSKIESIFKDVWLTKLKKYKSPLNVSMDMTKTQYAYYHSYGIGGKYTAFRTGNFYLDENKQIITGSSNDQNGYGNFKFTKLGKGYYMVTSLGVIYTGINLNHKKVGGYSLFIKMHGNKKMTITQKYTGLGKTYHADSNKKHTYYRR